MKYVAFGNTGIRVSPVCLGTMTFGKEADEPTSRALMDRAFDAGINFFDTANIYKNNQTIFHFHIHILPHHTQNNITFT